MRLLSILFLALLPFSALAKDQFAGFYEGKILGAPDYPLRHSPEVYGQIVKEKSGTYRFDLLSSVLSRSEVHTTASGLKCVDGKIAFKSTGAINLEGVITPDTITAKGESKGNKLTLSLKRMNIVSPTMGLKAPQGAVVLFDGKNTDKWIQCYDSEPCVWEVKDGSMKARSYVKEGKRRNGSIRSKEKFGAFKLHVEFQIPPTGPGNSGVYVGPYEIQVINSFGTNGSWYECGSIYRQHPPKVNACLEPEAWQTYDIEFHPAVFEGDKLISHPTFTVWHNGVRIHNADPVYYSTYLHPVQGAKYVHPKCNHPIELQDHGDSVSYRNIWLQKL